MTQVRETAQNLGKDDIFSREPYSDEPPLESYLHLQQMMLLINCLDWLWRERNDYYATGNQTIYYSPQQKKSIDFRGPDFFVVLKTEKRPRNSWVVWQEEGKYPNVIVELLSDSTADVDRSKKKEIYQDIFKTPNYFWFSPQSLELVGLKLIEGKYQEIEPNEQGWLWSEELQLYLGIYEQNLRFFTSAGELVPTPEESSISEQIQKELAQQQTQQERLQKELAQQQIQQERREKELAQQQIQQERLQKELAQQEAQEAQQQIQQERLEKEFAQKQAQEAQKQVEQERQEKEKLAAKLRELGIEPDNL